MDSSDEDVPLASLNKSSKAKRKVANSDSESDFDSKPSSTRKKKVTSYKESDDEDDDSEDEKPIKKKAVKPEKKGNDTPKRKAAPKKMKEESDADEDDDDDDEFDEPDSKKPIKNKVKVESKATSKKKPAVKKEASSSSSSSKKGGGRLAALKELTKTERLDQAMKAFKWWEHPDLPNGKQWRTMEHNGLAFPPEYEQHNVPLYYDGEPIRLNSEQEELATFFAVMPLDGPQLGDPETKPVFEKNFFQDFKKALGKDHKIQKFNLCNFDRIREHLEKAKMIRKAATLDEKASAKEDKQEMAFKFGYCIVDGHLEKVGNTMAEPPSLFRGRGKHPLTGKVKQRIMPEQVTINIGRESKVPICPQPGHAWGRIQHDDTVTWLSSWHENVLGSNKYMMLAAQSSFKGKSDCDKYGKAMRLKGCIDKIRSDYKKNINSKNKFNRQLATAMWVIDILALRVGGEKGEDEADTVGCCSLRVEHVNFKQPGQGEFDIELEFLGKDSMLYKQTTDFNAYGETGRQIYNNFVFFCEKKKKSEQILDLLDPPSLNKHLSSLMPGLTAKVFRTYNASETLQNELPTQEALSKCENVTQKVMLYNEANKKVAILCNHQRTVSKAQETGLAALADRLVLLKKQKSELSSILKAVKKNDTKGIQLKTEGAEEMMETAKKALEKAKALTEKAKTEDEKIAATIAMESAKEMQKKSRALSAEAGHLFAKTPSAEAVEKRIQTWKAKIVKLEMDIQNKDDNKEVALGTSKINYCDPRITVAWCKRSEVPIDRVFAKTLRDKFVWAMFVPPDWKFEAEK